MEVMQTHRTTARIAMVRTAEKTAERIKRPTHQKTAISKAFL